MKITRVETVLLSAAPTQPVSWSGGEVKLAHAALVQVHTDEGVTGLGDVYTGLVAPLPVPGVVQHYELLLAGEDPTQVGRLYEMMRARTLFWGRAGLGIIVAGAIETALWDILGKVRGQPVYELLGGRLRDRLPVYASGGMERPWDELEEEMRGYLAQGFRAVKIRIGVDREHDLEKVARVREWLGPDTDLMVDAVQGHNPEPWTAAQAIEVGRALAPYRIRWLEEPCFAADYDGYARVRERVPMPVAGGESSTTIHEFKHFFRAGGLDVAQPDACHAGGIQECRKIAALAEAHGVEVAFHSWGTSATMAPNYHLALVTPNCSYVEYPTWGFPLTEALFVERPVVRDGHLHLPVVPGLGIELTEEVRRKYPFQPTLGTLMRRVK